MGMVAPLGVAVGCMLWAGAHEAVQRRRYIGAVMSERVTLIGGVLPNSFG